MQPNTSNKPTQNRAALKSFEAGSLDVWHEIPEGAIPELPTDDLAAVVRTVMERGFRHLVIESRGAQRVETLIANSLAKYLQISSGQLSVTRLMFRRNEVAFTTWKEQVIGEPLRSS
jgi:anaerobic glycerol-3-phosphate dehydrogenase